VQSSEGVLQTVLNIPESIGGRDWGPEDVGSNRYALTVATSLVLTLFVGKSQNAPADRSPTQRLLAPYGMERFSELYKAAIDAYFTAQQAYRDGNYARASAVLKDFWERHPPGTLEWGRALSDADAVAETPGLNFGRPVCYYALRMLTDCAAWRTKAAAAQSNAIRPIVLTVLLVGHTSGVEPATRKELEDDTGKFVVHSLDPVLEANGPEVIHQSLWLFEEYIRAATGGKLRVETSIVSLPDLDIPVLTTSKPHLATGLAPIAERIVWQAVSDQVKARTDWWWILYPAHFPTEHPDFVKADFVGTTGAMELGPDGISPVFLSEDTWLVNKRRPIGKGRYSAEERMAYIPQWLQHEFFHHLFRTYPEFKLEAKLHQWFDRSTWPSDFDGIIEPDYYAEALHKRLQPLADPPLDVKLRYAPPPVELLRRITPAMLLGTYRRHPVENPWLEGTIDSPTPRAMRWTNNAGRSWRLEPNLAKGSLLTGPDNPYYYLNPATGREFRIVLRLGSAGDYIAEVAGFRFNGEFYSKDER
jgi:hypothetical protein